MPSYVLSVLDALKGVIKKIQAIQRNFLWGLGRLRDGVSSEERRGSMVKGFRGHEQSAKYQDLVEMCDTQRRTMG